MKLKCSFNNCIFTKLDIRKKTYPIHSSIDTCCYIKQWKKLNGSCYSITIANIWVKAASSSASFAWNKEPTPRRKNNNSYVTSLLHKKKREKEDIIDFRTYGVIHFLFANYLQSRFLFQLGWGWRGCPYILHEIYLVRMKMFEKIY